MKVERERGNEMKIENGSGNEMEVKVEWKLEVKVMVK